MSVRCPPARAGALRTVALGAAILIAAAAWPGGGCSPRAALNPAGEPLGTPRVAGLHFTIEADPVHAPWAQVFADHLVAAGMRVSVRVVDRDEIFFRAREGDLEACIVGWSGATSDALALATRKLASDRPENLSGYRSFEFDALLTGCLAAPDEDDRSELAALLREWLWEEAPWLFGVCFPLYDASTANLGGWSSGPGGAVRLRDAVVEEGDGRIRVGLGSARHPCLDPFSPADPQTAVVRRALFDALVTRESNGELVPELARDWEWSSTGRHLLVRLKNGVLFHNGDVLSAADVVFTYEAVLPERLPPGVSAEVHAVGALEVRFSFSCPMRDFLDDHGFQPIVPAGYYLRRGPEGFSSAPVGAGPYRLEPERDGLVLVRWESYHGTGRTPDPKVAVPVREIVFDFVPETERRAAMVRNGVLSLAPSLPPAAAADLMGLSGITVARQPGLAAVFVELNNRRPPFGDARVRLGLNLALDRRSLLTAFGLEARILPGALLPGGPGYDESPAHLYDIDLAWRFLRAAGYTPVDP